MEKQTINFSIERTSAVMQTGSFWLPAACERLCIEHNLEPPVSFLVFLLLIDPDGKLRFQKQLSYSMPVIRLGADGTDTTIGGIPGVLAAGKWTVEVYLFAEYLTQIPEGVSIPFTLQISDEDKEVPETIGDILWADETFCYSRLDKEQVYQKGTRWYKGDLHTHTQLSDGMELPFSATEKMRKMGLDYYVATEHNVVHTGWPKTPVLVMPGVEITTVLGHANLFGLTGRPKHLTEILRDKENALLKKNIDRIVEECRREGWLFSINHPFLHIWKWLYEDIRLSDVQCLEIINDPTYESDPEADAHIANEKAVYLSDLLWEDGYRICAIGGSDSHKKEEDWYPGADGPSIPGDPATYLYMEDLSEAHVLSALKNCRSYVTRRCEVAFGLYAQTEASEWRPVVFGDRLSEEETRIRYRIEIKGQEEKPDCFYLHNGVKKPCDCTQVMRAGETVWSLSGELDFSGDKYEWVRFGARDAKGDFLWYANPISKGKRAHRFQTFGEIKEYLEQQWQTKGALTEFPES